MTISKIEHFSEAREAMKFARMHCDHSHQVAIYLDNYFGSKRIEYKVEVYPANGVFKVEDLKGELPGDLTAVARRT